jgi:hypothetical protein
MYLTYVFLTTSNPLMDSKLGDQTPDMLDAERLTRMPELNSTG